MRQRGREKEKRHEGFEFSEETIFHEINTSEDGKGSDVHGKTLIFQ